MMQAVAARRASGMISRLDPSPPIPTMLAALAQCLGPHPTTWAVAAS
jgi:hypothetical protein